MTRIPLGDTGYEIEKVAIEKVRNSDVLIFDYGNGPERFEVDAIGFSSKQESPGVFVNTYTLTLLLQDGGGQPQIAERPAGSEVARLVKTSNP